VSLLDVLHLALKMLNRVQLPEIEAKNAGSFSASLGIGIVNRNSVGAAHEAEKDQQFFASISGKLDAIEHLQCKVQDIKEAHKVEVSLCLFLCSILTVNRLRVATRVMGSVGINDAGNALQLKWQHSATSTNEDENKENSTPIQLCQAVVDFSHRYIHADMMVGLTELQRKSRSGSLRNTSVQMRTITLQGKCMSAQCQPCSWSSMKFC